MSNCFFCTLLCELPEEPVGSAVGPKVGSIGDCSVRNESLKQIDFSLSRAGARLPRVHGVPVSINEAISAARKLLGSFEQTVSPFGPQKSRSFAERETTTGQLIIEQALEINQEAPLLITGNIQTVETSRAVLAFASENNAILDPFGSDPAFAQILATQRGGFVSASLSEVRFRSDCIVIVGDDRLLRSMPRLPNLLVRPQSSDAPSTATRVVLMGNWTNESVFLFRSLGFETQAIQMDPCDFPKAIRDWSNLSLDERSHSANLPSQWMESAVYLTIVWSSSNLNFEASDLWIERLQGWIAEQNSNRRVVSLSLAGSYQTFQQVATWTTGFPGRMRLQCAPDGELTVDYQPNRFRCEAIASLSHSPVVIQVDDTAWLPTNTSSIEPDILISPAWLPTCENGDTKKQMVEPKVFLPCALPGIEANAQYFRTDSVYSVKVGPPVPANITSVAELLKAISLGARS